MIAWDYYSSYALLGQVTHFHICGDNIDHTMKQCYTRVGKTRPDEIHYFHSLCCEQSHRLQWFE